MQASSHQFSSISNSSLQTRTVWKLILEQIEYSADVCHILKGILISFQFLLWTIGMVNAHRKNVKYRKFDTQIKRVAYLIHSVSHFNIFIHKFPAAFHSYILLDYMYIILQETCINCISFWFNNMLKISSFRVSTWNYLPLLWQHSFAWSYCIIIYVTKLLMMDMSMFPNFLFEWHWSFLHTWLCALIWLVLQ